MNAVAACVLLGAALLAPAAGAQSRAQYVARAGASDAFEMGEARLAQAHASSPRVRRAAAMMLRDHAASTAQVAAAVRNATGRDPAPAVLTSQQRRLTSDLRRTSRRDFDRAYVDQQVEAHVEALELHTRYAAGGSDPELRRAAATIVPVVQQHLDMWRDLQSRGG